MNAAYVRAVEKMIADWQKKLDRSIESEDFAGALIQRSWVNALTMSLQMYQIAELQREEKQ